MLAETLQSLESVTFPVLATPKLDGIRCLKINGKALSRSLKPIPNHHIRNYIEANCPDGFDGEIVCLNKSFNEIQSLVMTEEGSPEFSYVVFDYVKDDIKKPYSLRMNDLSSFRVPANISILLPTLISDISSLIQFEQKCVDEGHEGTMIRSLNSPYKCGRSTLKEGFLLKIKRFFDAEAIVLSFDEQTNHENTLGMLYVQDVVTGVRFGIGTGFDAATRAHIWKNQANLKGKLVTYLYQKSGMKDKPRFPVFKGFRDSSDT